MQPTYQAITFAEPGAVESMRCAVCGSECLVRRSVDGPTGFIMAMAKKSRLHDVFTCPHLNSAWHEQASRLFQAIRDTPSPRIAALMQQDLDDLLKANMS